MLGHKLKTEDPYQLIMALDSGSRATMLRYKKGSLLKTYLVTKVGFLQEEFTLQEIIRALVRWVSEYKLYDSFNPAMILCSRELESVLGMTALHVSELGQVVLQHIQNHAEVNLQAHLRDVYPRVQIGRWCPRMVGPRYLQHVPFRGDPTFPFRLQPKFLEVIRSVNAFKNIDNGDSTRTVFGRGEVVRHFCSYVLENRAKLFDPRNVKVVLVGNDPLGDAFQVKVFHRCQTNRLIDRQLLCISLAHQCALMVGRHVTTEVGLRELEIPRVLKSLILRTMSITPQGMI